MKSRRALSTVVGAVFAIIALTSTVTYVSYSMGILDNYNQSVLTKNQQLSDVNKEKFQISSVTVPSNGRLNMTIVNTGSLPINFTKIWIQNTSASDWVHSYTPTNSFVVPGGTLKKIGQDIPVSINSLNSYNIKIVTNRGNSQQVDVNSANTYPINIQLMALPPSISSGFKTELVMTVTNNGTGTLTNLVPILTPNGSPTATCTPDPVSPAKYDTLAPGNTAIFSWSVMASGTQDGQTCNFGAQLRNGYAKNFGNATITVTTVKLANTDYAANAGVITIDYTSFRWTQNGNGWSTGWSPGSGPKTAFSVQLANNNSTNGGTSLWLSEHALLIFFHASSTNSGTPFWIVGTVNQNAKPDVTVTSYPSSCANGDYCLSIPYKTPTTVYFSASADNGGSTPNTFPQSNDQYIGFIVLLGKFSNNQYGAGGSMYGQTIPFIAVRTS